MKTLKALLGVAAVVVALFIAAEAWQVQFLGDRFENVPCNCPNSERIVTSVDWLGDGETFEYLQSWGVGLQGDVPLIELNYDRDDLDRAEAALGHLNDGLSAAGASLEKIDEETFTAHTQDVRIEVWAPFERQHGPPWRIEVEVELLVHDSQAEGALSPFVEVFGNVG